MNNEIEYLLKEYVDTANSIKLIMFKDFYVQTKKQLIEKKLSFIKGELTISSNNKYKFHGRGCKFTSGDFEIDWDFGLYEIWCGINPRLFFYYLCHNHKIENNLTNYNMIECAINEMVNNGILVKEQGLYYFIEQSR